MAFSFRKMFSNISYFKRPDDENECDLKENGSNKRRYPSLTEYDRTTNVSYERTDLDLSNRKYAIAGKKSDGPIRHFTAKKVSLSNPDLSCYDDVSRKPKKLKLDIEKATKSMDEISEYANCFIENTPEQISLGLRADVFSARFKELDFNKSFDLFDYMSDGGHSAAGRQLDSDTDVSDFCLEVKMCRKVDDVSNESFEVLDTNEDDRLHLLANYQKKMDRIDKLLKDLLTEFEFDIEVTNVFVPDRFTTLPGLEFTKSKSYGTSSRDTTDLSWDAVSSEKKLTKNRMRKQLLSMQTSIRDFIRVYLSDRLDFTKVRDRRLRINKKKRDRSIQEFPDLRDVLHNLFNEDSSADSSVYDDKCNCLCHDSGITSKTPKSDTNQTITSSLGNFSLDISTLSMFSDTLDNLSYSSFNDTSLYNAILQKCALDRITFYVQVHGIRIKSDANDFDFESKSQIHFFCKACDFAEINERGLLKHILSVLHAEKIHFLYKTAYIRNCIENNVEIQPSTVLNPMLMYRDFNKIVCFGDGKYACSLCFENYIVGESVLMGHCNEVRHIERRNALHEIFE